MTCVPREALRFHLEGILVHGIYLAEVSDDEEEE